MTAAGWYRVPSSVNEDRGTFHYFRAEVNRSLCGAAAGYQVPADAPHFPEMSIIARMVAPFCGRCDRVRRPQEGR